MKTPALLITLVLGCMAVTAQAATTANRMEMHQEVVSYADLNLQSPAGAEKLRKRIKAAARRVCGLNDIGLIPLGLRSNQFKCAYTAEARAIADVQSRTVVVARAP